MGIDFKQKRRVREQQGGQPGSALTPQQQQVLNQVGLQTIPPPGSPELAQLSGPQLAVLQQKSGFCLGDERIGALSNFAGQVVEEQRGLIEASAKACNLDVPARLVVEDIKDCVQKWVEDQLEKKNKKERAEDDDVCDFASSKEEAQGIVRDWAEKQVNRILNGNSDFCPSGLQTLENLSGQCSNSDVQVDEELFQAIREFASDKLSFVANQISGTIQGTNEFMLFLRSETNISFERGDKCGKDTTLCNPSGSINRAKLDQLLSDYISQQLVEATNNLGIQFG